MSPTFTFKDKFSYPNNLRDVLLQYIMMAYYKFNASLLGARVCGCEHIFGKEKG